MNGKEFCHANDNICNSGLCCEKCSGLLQELAMCQHEQVDGTGTICKV